MSNPISQTDYAAHQPSHHESENDVRSTAPTSLLSSERLRGVVRNVREQSGRIADMLGRLDGYQVRLLHVIRGGSQPDLAALEENGAIDTGAVFKAPMNILTVAGFDPQHISTKTITGVISRAGAIVNMANRGGWGTIVVGRRGLSSVSDFFMGRVSNKVVHAGRKETVWIVT